MQAEFLRILHSTALEDFFYSDNVMFPEWAIRIWFAKCVEWLHLVDNLSF